jgi:hypothetical protein
MGSDCGGSPMMLCGPRPEGAGATSWGPTPTVADDVVWSPSGGGRNNIMGSSPNGSAMRLFVGPGSGPE